MYYNLVMLTSPLLAITLYYLNQSFYEEKRCERKIELLSYMIYSIFVAATTLAIPKQTVYLSLNIGAILCLSYIYKMFWWKRIIYSLVPYFLNASLELLQMGLVTLWIEGKLVDPEVYFIVGLISYRVVLVAISILIAKYHKHLSKNHKISQKYYIFTIINLLGTFLLFQLGASYEVEGYPYWILSSIILLATNVGVFLMYEQIHNMYAQRIRQTVLETQIEAYKNQNQITDIANRKIQSIKHDMKNHLLALDVLAKEKKTKEIDFYIQRILKEMPEPRELALSGNYSVDSILNHKLAEVTEDVVLDVDLQIPKTMAIMEYDMTVILGNLLDNARDALFMQKDGEKVLKLKMKIAKENLLLFIDNTYNGEVRIQDGRIATTNPEKNEESRSFGWGIQNVETVLKKYNGSMKIDYDSQVFRVMILIPLNESNYI